MSRRLPNLFAEDATLATRLVVLFTLGSALLMSGVGYWLYHALQQQLDDRELAEVRGKTEIIQHLRDEMAGPDQLAVYLPRLRDIAVGHPHITVGVRRNDAWLLNPPSMLQTELMESRSDRHLRAEHIASISKADTSWWVKRISYKWAGDAAAIEVYLIIDVSESRQILREHGWSTVVAVLLGSLISGLLAFFAVRRGLAPLKQVAAEAERMTTDRLGAPLDIAHAPGEVRRLVASLNRMLERLGESFRSLEQFSADIAHELRTPLNNLMLRTQVTLSRPRESTEYQEALLGNLEELERLQRMVSDMLFLARADRGMLKPGTEVVDLRLEADSLAEFFELAASERGQHITVGGSATVTGDRLMIRRAITNLLSNAVRYAPDGAAIAIDINPAPHSTLTVRNLSEAIPADQLTHLFSRFARKDDSRNRDTDGVGLGLAIVESIMRLHGGTVLAQSQGGQIEFCLMFTSNSMF
ncbi:sensor histidine kinase [Chitinimonas naiadis]